MWYAVYEVATGELRSSGSTLAETLPEGLAVKTFNAAPQHGWNSVTLEFDVVPEPEREALTSLGFLQRFTVQERVTIRTAAKSDPVIEDFLDLIYAAQEIKCGHPLLLQGLGYMVMQGFITQERAAEIGDF